MADTPKYRPALRVVGAAAEEGIEIPEAVSANWQAAMGIVLQDGGVSGTVLYRTAQGAWGMAHTPDLGATDAWGLIDIAHEFADMKKLEELSEE